MGKIVLRLRSRNDREIRERNFVSYSFREPEWPAVCECKYDEARDEMNREDCPFHCDPKDSVTEEEMRTATRKRPEPKRDVKESAA